MNYLPCAFRRDCDGNPLHFCSHPRVHLPDGILNPSICHACGHDADNVPARNGTVDNTNTSARFLPFLVRVAVVIPCHNYGRFLRNALQSVLRQTLPAAEVIVVDDASVDETAEIVREFPSVRYVRIAARNVLVARKTGFDATISPVLCFLDADDELSENYLRLGVAGFRSSPNVGVVHSDLHQFGLSDQTRAFPDIVEREMLGTTNLIHAGSLVRRDALILSRVFEFSSADPPDVATADWWVWKKVLLSGWKSVRQSGAYLYRRHSASLSLVTVPRQSYFESAHLAHERLTLFIPLSGRGAIWPQLRDFLDSQLWPHDQLCVLLMDTSGNPAFSAEVRQWMAECDYRDIRHIQMSVGIPGLADRPRTAAVADVRRAMARIYNFLARRVETDYVWILEDDVIPPVNACEALLHGFDERAGSVAAPYRSRFQDAFVVWDRHWNPVRAARQGLTTEGGNGFGCVVIRSSLLRDRVFSANSPYPDFDHEFYAHLQLTGLVARVDWRVEARHLDNNPDTAHRHGKVHVAGSES